MKKAAIILATLLTSACASQPWSEVTGDWQNVASKDQYNVNITGVFNMMRAGLPHLKAAGGGAVLTIGSGASQRPLEGWSAYCTSKAGAAMLTACTDHEYRSSGIRAMGLSPGTVATQMQIDIKASGMNPVSQLDWSEHIPPEWPAKVLLWMCSKEADPFIGQEIRLKDPEILEAAGLA